MTDRTTPPSVCGYCGDRPPRQDRPRYRGRPCCRLCRAGFLSGEVPKPPFVQSGRPCRNGPSDLQRFPADVALGWDDVVRAVEDARCD